jgi:hypothetical protein
MADDPDRGAEVPDAVEIPPAKEDAETTAARRELKQTSISEKVGTDTAVSEDEISIRDELPARTKTPVLEMPQVANDELKEQISSPKKKRAHDQLDEQKDSDDGVAPADAAAKPENGSAMTSRTDRSEPEKKRARDQHDDDTSKAKDAAVSCIV